MTKFAYKIFPHDGSVIIQTATLFYPCNSWLNQANIKGSIAHEQLHFDIAEYFKRLFLKRIAETRSSQDMFAVTTPQNINTTVPSRPVNNNLITNVALTDREQEMINEINNLRADPARYCVYIENYLQRYQGDADMKAAANEVVAILKKMKPLALCI